MEHSQIFEGMMPVMQAVHIAIDINHSHTNVSVHNDYLLLPQQFRQRVTTRKSIEVD